SLEVAVFFFVIVTMILSVVVSIFFFQAEDGIRDFHVTGVQTCALPICTTVGPAAVATPGAGVNSRIVPSARSRTRYVPADSVSGSRGPERGKTSPASDSGCG